MRHIERLVKHCEESLTFSNSLNIFNLGTGVGVSVLEMINAMEEVIGINLPLYVIYLTSSKL